MTALAEIHNLGELVAWDTIGTAYAKPVLRWTSSDPDGDTITYHQVRIYDAAVGGTKVYDSGLVAGNPGFHNAEYAMVNGDQAGSSRWWTVQLYDGEFGIESARREFKVIWGRAIYEYTAPGLATSSSWEFTATVPGVKQKATFLFRSSSTTGGTGPWKATISEVTPDAYMQVLVRISTWEEGVPATVTNMEFSYTGASQQPDQWARGVAALLSASFDADTTGAWPNPEVGPAWIGGTHANLSASGGLGRVTHSVAGVSNRIMADINVRDTPVTGRFRINQTPVGSVADNVIEIRSVDGNNMYRCYVRLLTTGFLQIFFYRIVGAVAAVIGTILTTTLAPAGGFVRFRVEAEGVNPTTLRAKLWLDGTTEPDAWTHTTTDSSAALQVAADVGVISVTNANITSLPMIFEWDDIRVGGGQIITGRAPDADWQLDPSGFRYGTKGYRFTVTDAFDRLIYPFRSVGGDDIPVAPNTDYVLSCYVKTAAPLASGSELRLEIWGAGGFTSLIAQGTLAGDGYDDGPGATTDTSPYIEGWQRIHLRFKSGPSTSLVRPVVRYRNGSVGSGDQGWVDGVQLEEGIVVSPWHPGWISNAAITDGYGAMYDAMEGARLRLRDSAGTVVGIDDIVSGLNHPDAAAHDALGLATQSELDTHAGLVAGGTGIGHITRVADGAYDGNAGRSSYPAGISVMFVTSATAAGWPLADARGTVLTVSPNTVSVFGTQQWTQLGGVSNRTFVRSSTGASTWTAWAEITAAASGPVTKTQRVSASVNGSASAVVAFTWPTAFADAAYKIALSVHQVQTGTGTASIYHAHIVEGTKTASGASVRITNMQTTLQTIIVELIAIHD